MLNLLLFGPPGAGKGTQSTKLIERYGLIHLSTGDILRSEIAKKSVLGLEARKFIDAGKLVPDKTVIGMIACKLEEQPDARGFIFDGFPRTCEQAIALDKMLREKGTSISLMILLEVEYNELINRLLLRSDREGRTDDNKEIIEQRISLYKTVTEQVAGYYKKKGKLRSVDGAGSIEEIFERITEIIDQFNEEHV